MTIPVRKDWVALKKLHKKLHNVGAVATQIRTLAKAQRLI